jgi:hypothetical protein
MPMAHAVHVVCVCKRKREQNKEAMMKYGIELINEFEQVVMRIEADNILEARTLVVQQLEKLDRRQNWDGDVSEEYQYYTQGLWPIKATEQREQKMAGSITVKIRQCAVK